MAVFLGAIKGSKKNGFPQINKDFNKWLRGEWVTKSGDRYLVPYLEGWYKTFSKDEMFKIFYEQFIIQQDGIRFYPPSEIKNVIKYLKVDTEDLYFLDWDEFK